MEFALSDQQKMMQDSIDGALAKSVPARSRPQGRRWRRDRSPTTCGGCWSISAWPALIIPEEHGGLGLGLLEAALISEALGKHVVPVPFVATAVMAPLALMMAGSAAQQRRMAAEARVR